MTNVLPTLREKKRYLVFEVIDATTKGVVTAVNRQFEALFGSVTASQADIKLIKSTKNRAMLSVNRAYVDHTRAALAVAGAYTIGVSGMVNKADNYLKGV